MKIYSKTIKKQNKTKSSHNLDLSRQVINLLTKKKLLKTTKTANGVKNIDQ